MPGGLLVALIVLVCSSGGRGQSYENVTSLISTLLTDYNVYVRPVQDQATVMSINVSFNLYNLLEVDTVQGVVTMVAVLPTVFRDERITWSPAQHAGITNITIQQQYVWTPPFAFYQTIEFDRLGDKWIPVTYNYDGTASWNPGNVYSYTCPMNLKYWPYDEQKCTVSLVVYDSYSSEAKLNSGIFNVDYFSENGEWSLHDIASGITNKHGPKEMTFQFTLRRRYDFFTATLIIPLIVLDLINSFVFLLPSESGERMSFCITILLSFTVFLDVISDDIPKLSTPLPIICHFLLAGVITSGLITVIVIYNLVLFNREDHVPVPVYWKVLVRVVQCRTKLVYPDRDKHTQSQPRDMTVADLTVPEVRSQSTMANKNTADQRPGVTWKDVSHAIDRIFLALFTISGNLCAIVMIVTLKYNL